MERKLRWTSAALLAIPLVGCVSPEQRFVDSLRNQPAKDFQLKALDGGSVKLSDFRGKPVLLAFFAYG